MSKERRALGRGLGALIPPPRYANLSDDYRMCPLARIEPDPEQPRRRISEGSLDELVSSIKEKGIIQPLVVRQEGSRFVVVAGERRLRAAKRAGLTEVPVLVKDVATDEAFELALIENIQREDLNPIEEAAAYQRLLDRPGESQATVARRVGKDRSTVANALRLLKLDAELQQQVIDGELSSGHARSLLSVEEPARRKELARRIVDEGLSVRQTEQLAREKKADPKGARPRAGAGGPALKPYYDGVATELSEALGVLVQIASRGRKGKLVIQFGNVDELRRIRQLLLEGGDNKGESGQGQAAEEEQ